jgi:hypothetical protein
MLIEKFYRRETSGDLASSRPTEKPSDLPRALLITLTTIAETDRIWPADVTQPGPTNLALALEIALVSTPNKLTVAVRPA